jgi:hypothetical protein
LASHRKQARSVQVSTKLFRDLGSGRPPPLKLSLYLVIIETRPAFESEGEALRNLTAGLFRQCGRADDDDATRAPIQGGRMPGGRPSGRSRSLRHVPFRSHL